MILNCVIVDDEPMARKVLEEYIEDVDFLTLVGKAENPVKASPLLAANKVDLLFLDINMPRMSGIDFLKSTAKLPLTILTTAYSEYAVESFELDVLDYLVKPISFERFLKSAVKAKEYAELQNKPLAVQIDQSNNYFFVKCNGKIEKIFYDDLIYIEAMQNYIILHTVDKKLVVYLTIKNVAEQLPDQLFLKIHKSTIININKIKSIEGNTIDIGNTKVIISQNMHDAVMKEIVKDKLLKR